MAVNYFLQFGTGDPRTFTGLAPTLLIFKDVSGTNQTPPGITEIPSSTGLYYFSYGTTNSIFFLADAATTSPGAAGRYVAGNLDPSDRMVDYGITIVAIGTSITAQGVSILANNNQQGATLVAIGNSSIALGTTNVALGTSIAAGQVQLGSTLVAIGNTSIAQGVTEIALGNTILASVGSGLTLMAAIGSTASLIGDLTHDPVDLFGYVKRIAELYQGQQSFTKGSNVLTMLERTGATTLAQRTIVNSASLVLKS